MSVTKSSSGFFSVFRYKKKEYSSFFLLVFICVIFEAFILSSTLALSDILFSIFAFYCFVNSRPSQRAKHIFIYPVAFLLIAVIDYFLFHNGNMFFSQLRFVFNCGIFVILLRYVLGKGDVFQNKVLNTYIYVCVLFSAFLIIQYLSFYLLRINLSFDFGRFQGEMINHASLESVSGGGNYRTGGVFREPSYFALFLAPVLEICFQQKKWKELIVCTLGLVFSTSSLAFLFIFIFLLGHIKFKNIKYAFLIVALIAVVYFVFPSVFLRLFDALDFSEGADNSNSTRVFIPFALVYEGGYFPIFGMDIGVLYGLNEELFLNTFLFVLTSFGIIGLVILITLLVRKQNWVIAIILVVAIIIEGCYGRIDFWMMLLGASLFSRLKDCPSSSSQVVSPLYKTA